MKEIVNYTMFERMFLEWMMYFAYKWSCVRAFFTEMVTRVCCTPMPLYVYKVVRYEDNMTETDCTDDYYKGKPIAVAKAQPITETENEPLSENENRLEYRVTWNRRNKYRIVSTNSNIVYPHHELFVGTGTLSSRPKILCAVLKDSDGECNVIERVLKYAGPNHEFFNQHEFKMKWMFEHDDLKEDTILFVLFSNGSHRTFSANDTIQF